MHDVMRKRLWRKLEALPDEQLYQVLDFIEFLEAKYAPGKAPAARIDYVELRDPDSLQPVDKLDGPVLLVMAVFVGATRLLDNRVIR